MVDSGDTPLRASTAIIAPGETDRILERHAARVNSHDLAKCEGWEGPVTPDERRQGVDEWYVFYACQRCGVETTLPPHRWETITCEPGEGP